MCSELSLAEKRGAWAIILSRAPSLTPQLALFPLHALFPCFIWGGTTPLRNTVSLARGLCATMASASITAVPANTTSTALLPSVTVSGLTYSSPPTPIPGTRIISSRDKDWTVYTLAGPLTTAISATASSCRQTWLLETLTGSLVLNDGTSRFTEGLQCTSGLGAIPQGCMPGNNEELFATGAFSTGASSNATRISVIPYFSPATGCPEGYATACTTTLPSGFPPKPTEDIYACRLPYVTHTIPYPCLLMLMHNIT